MPPHRVKRALIGAVAVASLAWSLWVLALTAASLLRGGVHPVGTVGWFRFFLSPATAVILVWLSMRGFRLAAGIERLDQPRIKVWRVCTGVILLATLLETILVPSSRKYQADNASQLLGMYIAWFFCSLFSIWLIRSGFPRDDRGSTSTDGSISNTGASA